MKLEARLAGIIIIIFSLLIASFLIFSYFTWSQKYQQHIYPGVHLGNLDLSGKTYQQAEALINERLETIQNNGLTFTYNKKSAILMADVASFDSDLSHPAFLFDKRETLTAAYGNSSDRTFLHYLINLIKTKNHQQVAAIYQLNEGLVIAFLKENFPELNIEAKNASFTITDNSTNHNLLKIVPETPGKEINYEQILQEINNQLNNVETGVITIKTQSKYPLVKEADLINISAAAEKIINRGSLTLLLLSELGTSTRKSWVVTPQKIVTWLSLQDSQNQKIIFLDYEKIKSYLTSVIAPQVNLEASLPRFEIKNGKVSSWQKGQSGQKLELENNAINISQEYLSGRNEVSLLMTEIPSEEPSGENMQIKEIIGTGHSNFAGSPANRRHNIQTGANALHGLLIKPGEEFSLLKTIGEVNAQTGYLTELVIKGDKTIPEFGGGLCQIGTTIFRSALSSGLPITMRQNHSYRVSYYEPAGTDATIYIPNPDFRFLNDTGNYILIQSRLVKNDLYFDLWGVKDGRLATTTYPVIYNIVEPEPTKLVESNDLKPGEKKCTEKSHNGADAYFDYTVIYPSTSTTPNIKERRFKSHYVPWRAVCLIGKSTSSSMMISSSTPSGLGTSSLLNASSSLKASSSSLNKKTTGTAAVISTR